MENTLENKAKFFAQYWGQKILRHPEYKSGLYSYVNDYFITPFTDDGYYLELKPLSSITDEDAIEVAELEEDLNLKHFIECGKPLVITQYGYVVQFGNTGKKWTSLQVDFLRSKGYALPYMGLSVEELVNRNWIKLKH